MDGEISKEDIEYFLTIGVLEFSHTDENGDKIYSLTEKAEEIAPIFYENQMKDFNAILFSLWSKGVLDLTFDDDGSPLIGISEDTQAMLENQELDEEEKEVMQQIVSSWLLKNPE